MKNKFAFAVSLGLAITFTCAPIVAQASPQNGAPPQPPPTAQSMQPQGYAPQPPNLPHLNRDQMDAQRTIPGAYRLKYTLTELDGAKRVASQRYEVVMDADAAMANLRLGTKIPIETAASGPNNLSGQTQISYIDLGMSIRAHLRQFANGLELNSHVVQSTVESQQSLLKTPVIRQTSIENTVLLSEGKPVILGNGDIPGTTHTLQVQVQLSRLP